MSGRRVVIVGGGPAGMMLAWQLASSGVEVRVLERHPDFRREVRGELMQRSVVEQLEKAGLFERLLERGLALPDLQRQMYVGPTRKVRTPGPTELGAVVNQPGFLELLHEQCSTLPNYRLDFGTVALEAIREGDAVVGLKTRSAGAEARVDADLFVVCNGRNSALRKSCGLETETFESTADALWLRFDFMSESHDISQAIATPSGSYWHGILHRREPDAFNAKYWMARVGEHPIFSELLCDAKEIAANAPDSGIAAAVSALKTWDAAWFTDQCCSAQDSRATSMLLEIQRREWALLFDHNFSKAFA